MNKIVRTLILNAIKTYGKNPDRILLSIEDNLTKKEIKFVYGFLIWIVTSNTNLSNKNICKLLEDYKKMQPPKKKPNS
jgi:hypothetical protein